MERAGQPAGLTSNVSSSGFSYQADFAVAFAAADDELADSDWSQRLSEIQQEFCRTLDRVDSKKVSALETAMFNKLAFETHGVMAAYPRELPAAEAIRKWRVEGVKYFILKVRLRQFMAACYAPPVPDNATRTSSGRLLPKFRTAQSVTASL